MLKRYWGAGVEHVAKALSGDDKKGAEGSDYRRAHHHLTVTYEALMTVVIERFYDEHPGRHRQAADMEHGSQTGSKTWRGNTRLSVFGRIFC